MACSAGGCWRLGYPPAFADCRPSSVNDGTDTFAYAYQPGGDLIRTVTKSGTPALVAARAYEPTRDVLANIGNKAGPVVKSSYTYTVNSLGQRTNPLQAYSDWGKRIYHTQEEFDRAQQTSREVAYEATATFPNIRNLKRIIYEHKPYEGGIAGYVVP